jgi:hypothetical protein
MILPSKSIGGDLALISVGADILSQLDSSATVTALWDRVASARREITAASNLPFWWFALALDLLYLIGTVEIANGLVVKTNAS